MSLRSLALSVLTFSVLTSGLCIADANAQAKKKPDPTGADAQVFKLPKEITLTADQETKMATLKKEFGPKIAELQKKSNDILTKEQRAARKTATDKAKADGLKGKAAQEAVAAAVMLTTEQKDLQAAVKKDLDPLIAEVKKQIANMLTDEQKAKLPMPAKKKKDKAA